MAESVSRNENCPLRSPMVHVPVMESVPLLVDPSSRMRGPITMSARTRSWLPSMREKPFSSPCESVNVAIFLQPPTSVLIDGQSKTAPTTIGTRALTPTTILSGHHYSQRPAHLCDDRLERRPKSACRRHDYFRARAFFVTGPTTASACWPPNTRLATRRTSSPVTASRRAT